MTRQHARRNTVRATSQTTSRANAPTRVAAAGTLLAFNAIASAASIQFIGPCLATDISADGSVVVGNTVGDYETFRWTQGTGIVPLGRGTVQPLGVGAGTPDVSWDGTKISATIIDDTSSFATQGRWTLGSGWQQLMPPPPPGGGIGDLTLSSAWGMSGDGLTVSGHFSRPGQPGGFVHASSWTQAGGAVDLGSDGGQSSGRAANYDGSVIVGFDEHPNFGNRRPAVWVNGVKTVFTPNNDGPSELAAASADGKIVAGSDFNFPANHEEAAIWRFIGGNWIVQNLGVLPGTVGNGGLSIVSDLSADGSIAVGFNRFNGSNFLNATGFIWTQATGMISAEQYLNNNGITLPDGFLILDLSAISADGSTIVGSGVDSDFNDQSFIISIPEPGGLALLGLALPLLRRRTSR